MIFRPWAFWRRAQYLTGLFFLVGSLYVVVSMIFGRVEPTCFDGMQNGEERGVDCGGACEHICTFDIQIPTVLWAEPFKIVDGQYNVVAYIENRNKGVGVEKYDYTFTLYDDEGAIINRSGVTALPPDGVYPIFEGRIMTGSRIPTRAEIVLSDTAKWYKATTGKEQFTLEKRELVRADSKPRLITILRNNSRDVAKEVEIIATIFDASKHPLTASQTFITEFVGHSSEEVTFTWPEPIAKTLRSCEIPTDVILAIDLSGSMNNDGGVPSEPISSVLLAAQSFIEKLNAHDQIGIVTYASQATLAQMLTDDLIRTREDVGKLTIEPSEERGTTNIGDAFVRIGEELQSVRHNEDARKIAILLTDGLATAPDERPEEHAYATADSVEGMGVDIFTIGLGTSVNAKFLEWIATEKGRYYFAPSPKDLDSIYTSITKDICESGPAVIEVIAKPKTSFSQHTK